MGHPPFVVSSPKHRVPRLHSASLHSARDYKFVDFTSFSASFRVPARSSLQTTQSPPSRPATCSKFGRRGGIPQTRAFVDVLTRIRRPDFWNRRFGSGVVFLGQRPKMPSDATVSDCREENLAGEGARPTHACSSGSRSMIELIHLRKEYDELVAVQDLNLTIPGGEIFGLIGPNGAGKTTTIRMACGLLAPTTGRALVNGVDVAQEPERAQLSIGYLSDFFAVYEELKVWEYLRGDRAGVARGKAGCDDSRPLARNEAAAGNCARHHSPAENSAAR